MVAPTASMSQLAMGTRNPIMILMRVLAEVHLVIQMIPRMMVIQESQDVQDV